MALPTLLQEGSIIKQSWMKGLSGKTSIEYLVDYISDMKHNNYWERILLLKSGTGSGKSTTIVPALYDKYKWNVAITQPRRLTAMDIPQQIIQYNDNLKIGENIGYQVGGDKSTKPKEGITFMTIGVLLQQLKVMSDEEVMNKYNCIIIDEIHERDLNLDNIMMLMKQFLQRNYKDEKCPVFIMMSATFDESIFKKYFDLKKEQYIEVSGKSFEKKLHYSKYDVTNWILSCQEKVYDIHTENPDDDEFRDILIFIGNTMQMKEISMKIEELNRNDTFTKNGKVCVINLNSVNFNKGNKDYQNLFISIDKLKGFTRRVIIATNIAETGITIDTLKYCIDTGFVMRNQYNPKTNIHVLSNGVITQGMGEQRVGRVGRKAPGVAYLLYTEELYKKLLKDQYPQIITTDISPLILSYIVSKEDQFDPSKLDLLTMPSMASMNTALEKLYILGFIEMTNNTIAPSLGKSLIRSTKMGNLANLFRKVSLEGIRTIIAAYLYKCNVLDVITVVCFLEMSGMRYNRLEIKLDSRYSDIYRKIIINDEITEYLWLWKEYIKKKGKLPTAVTIQDDVLIKVTKLRDEIIELMSNIDLNPFENNIDIINILKDPKNIDVLLRFQRCFIDGYRMQIAVLNETSGEYELVYRKIPIKIQSDIIKPVKGDSEQERPKTILIGNLIYKLQRNGRYAYSGSNIMVLDRHNMDNFITSYP